MNATAEPPTAAAPTPADPSQRKASPELLAEIAAAAGKLDQAGPVDIIQWAVERFQPKLGMATAFGPEGLVILHFLAQIDPTVWVFNLDTGYQFKETLELRDKIAAKYGIEVEYVRAETSVEEYERQHDGPVYLKDTNQCCADRKVVVLRNASLKLDAWMSGIRRDQTADRAATPVVTWDKKFGLVKVSPLANFTKSQVWKLITDENIPYNPLHDQGYPSIGCWPCTRAVLPGEDERAGRWSGSAKTECGLHTLGGKD